MKLDTKDIDYIRRVRESENGIAMNSLIVAKTRGEYMACRQRIYHLAAWRVFTFEKAKSGAIIVHPGPEIDKMGVPA